MIARFRTAGALALSASLMFASCSSSSSDSAKLSTDTGAEVTTTVANTTGPDTAKLLRILVSNDDGYEAPGIDTLVEGLRALPDTKVIVVAPAEQQSGTGGKTSPDGEKLVTSDVKLTSGYEAQSVAGFPADTIRVAMDEQGIKPDLVVTGINSAQNLGPAADLSGTVGAARAAVARGVPALATSAGLHTEKSDYQAAMPFILDWIKENRTALLDGSAPVEVTNLNIPFCATGKIRGQLDVPADLTGSLEDALADSDCNSKVPEADLKGDVEAFRNGFVTLSVLKAEPAAGK